MIEIHKTYHELNSFSLSEKIHNENGTTNAIFLLFSIISIYTIENYWTQLFDHHNIFIQIFVFGFLICFVLYSFLVGTYTILSGEQSPRKLKKMVLKESKKLDFLIMGAESAVKELENQLRVLSGIMHPQGFIELRTLKAILISLKARSLKAKNLIRTNDEDGIIEGYNIFFSNIGDFEDANHSLILDSNLPKCSYEQIPFEIQKRIEFVEKTLPVKSSLAKSA
jgi:hypothetical protein